MESTIFQFSKNDSITITELIDYESFCGIEVPQEDKSIETIKI